MASAQDLCKIELRPFLHQVSGTKLMFYLNQATICKALIDNESHFYRTMPPAMRKFTAAYRGCMKIEMEEAKDGMLKFLGVVPHRTLMSLNPKFGGGAASCNNYKTTTLDCYEDPQKKADACTVLSARLAKIFHEQEHEVVLLENLVSGLNKPSVLDIKMGNRTHSDGDSDEKRQRKIRRAEKSTSSTLFMRLNGMQKYDRVTGKYETLGKLDGQRFTNEEYIATLIDFLYDGVHHRTDLIVPLLSKLHRLYDCVSQQDSYRFYSSSLLVIYDGGQLTDQIDVRMIDFAHTVRDTSACGPDDGYLQGIQSLIDIFSMVLYANPDMS